MHHYAHHIGDYRAHTAHLSMVEDGAYRRLLDLYYMHERPLPVDVAMCQRLTACRSKEERAAVDAILREFFTLEADGWHQRRADEVIHDYQEKAETARRNGRGGGRPKAKKEPTQNQPGSLSVQRENPDETVTVNRKPVTTGKAPTGLSLDGHQTSSPIAARGSLGGSAHNAPDFSKIVKRMP